MNRKIILSAVSIVTAAALMGGAAFAFFTDAASSNNNSFSSGVFDLLLQDNNESFRDDVTLSFVSPTNWAPGDKFTDFICFKNNNGIPIEQVLLRLTSTGAGSTTLDDFIYVSKIELGDVTATQATACASDGATSSEVLTDFTTLFNTRFGSNAPLSSLLTQIDGSDNINDDLLDGPAAIPTNDVYKLRVEWTFDTLATSAVEGQSVDLNVGFTATQNESP